MTVTESSSSRKRAPDRKRVASPAGCAATVLLTVTACGGGTAGTTDSRPV
jgi:multiple sugar transport system substrate-binding protein